MFPDCFYEHHNSLHQKIRRQFDLAATYFDVEGIHELRVEIKRLRAFFDLIEFINPNFQARKGYKKIRILFRAAGPIRDVHVQQELVRACSKKLALDLSEYYNFLKQKEMALRPGFAASCRKFDFTIFETTADTIRVFMQYLPAEFAQLKTQNQLHNLLQKLSDLKNPPEGNQVDFHQVRICLKAARYTLEVLQMCFQKGALDLLNAKLREMHQALGKWHDEEVGLQSLEAFLQEHDNVEFFSRDSYQFFAEELEEDKRGLLARFATKWNEFLDLPKM
ncbi:MAG TPA: CHAD domain-containing protein [bacterium]